MCWWSWSNVGLLCWYGMCWASRISLRQWQFKAFLGLGVYARQYIHSPRQTLWHRYWLGERARKGEHFWKNEFLWSILFANFWNVHSPRLRRIGSAGQRIAWKFIIWLFMCCSFPFKLRLDFFLKLKWTQGSRNKLTTLSDFHDYHVENVDDSHLAVTRALERTRRTVEHL